jgi:hypothetical protein
MLAVSSFYISQSFTKNDAFTIIFAPTMKKLTIVLVAFITLATITSCRKKGIPNAGLPASILKDTTTIEFAETEFNFGKIKQGEKVTHIFKFKNAGQHDLIIANAYGSCGCTVPEYPKEPLKPGAEGEIKVTFNSEGKQGEMHKNVTLQANTVTHSDQLFLNGEVEVPEEK